MRILLFLFPFLARYSDTCAPTRTTTPIVCACSTSEVTLIDRLNGDPTGANAIQPVGTVTFFSYIGEKIMTSSSESSTFCGRIANNNNKTDGCVQFLSPAEADTNNCPLIYTVTCDLPANAPTGATVNMMFQDQASAAVPATSLNLTCTDGNWLYSTVENGDQ
ncbi:hypothetical protein CAEBREN_19149 [Caenorhabditis brenneri]|uniref:C6 domain-containing protein n=1 Tax=Caenorhabditis brenneri TaxID=135651 RepID=G0P330_CAEBE|nr:hypothetical protein CAEBREN_19149 [Caenorhabditis brenneri]